MRGVNGGSAPQHVPEYRACLKTEGKKKNGRLPYVLRLSEFDGKDASFTGGGGRTETFWVFWGQGGF